MKFLTMFAMSTLILLVTACTGGGEPTAVPEPIETKPALETAVPTPTSQPTTDAYPDNNELTATSEPVEGYPPAAPTLEPVNPYPGQDGALISDPVVDSAYPAEANMSDLPTGPGDGQPEEAPRPGVPNEAVAITQQVSEDLAARLRIDVGEIGVISSADVEWSDGALGCPQEGFAYVQVITPGYQIVLEANNQQYTYHTDMNGNFLLCQDGKPVFD